MDATIARLQRAVVSLTRGYPEDAIAAIRAIDCAVLLEIRASAYARVREARRFASLYHPAHPGAKRLPVKREDKRATFIRDRYTCRYAHCLRETVDLDVLKLLSKAFPAVLPYHSNWRPVADHILYWTYSTSVEHAVPFPAGGNSEPENLLTGCYLCNDVKKHLPADLLGWSVSPVPQSQWRGLTEYLPDLRRAVANLAPNSPGA